MGGFSERRHHLLLKFVLDSNRNRRFGPQKLGRHKQSLAMNKISGKACARDLKKRYASIDKMLQDLESIA